MPEPTFKLDHFKFYRVDVEHPPGNVPVLLKGQFETAPRQHNVLLLSFFGIPVSKGGARIRNSKTHLSWHILAGAHEDMRTVGIVNQFGRDVLRLGDPAFLLAPAVKQRGNEVKPAEVPADVSHFKGYRILRSNEFKPRTVTLKDQFDTAPVRFKVEAPMFFCVPVEKKAGDKAWPVVNPEDHLVIYPVPIRQYPGKRPVWDQFKGGMLQNFRAWFLAVPSKKLAAKEGFLESLEF